MGTKSLLFGAHQFILHPIFVFVAWKRIYKEYPDWRTSICIIFHDWGYVGCPEIDGERGKMHPLLGAKIARKLFGKKYYELCIYHSRHYADKDSKKPSKLCWADKLGVALEPWWLYLPKARLTGELTEYRLNAIKFIPMETSDKKWYIWIQSRFRKIVENQDATVTKDIGHIIIKENQNGNNV
jgi:hypothetical protein